MDVMTLDCGDRVICDWGCGEEYTNSEDSGGILFGSKAICPACQLRAEESIRRHGEGHYIRGRCPENMSFADWVRSIR